MPHPHVLPWSMQCALQAVVTVSLLAGASCDRQASPAASRPRTNSHVDLNAPVPTSIA